VFQSRLEAGVIDVSELLKGVSTEYQNQVYEKMNSMTEDEQERFAEEIAAAIASSPEAQGTMEARARQRELREANAPKVGEEAPDFELASLEGDRRVRLSAHRGRPVGLIFGSYT
jgi:hypothetical protein